MKKFLVLGALLVAGSLALQDVSIGHGGSYRGPGDTVPPGGGGGGGGGTGPSTPGPSGPSTGGPSGPSTPGPAGPGVPTGGPAGRPAGPSTGATISGPDLTTWEFWWGFNKDQYLNLKAHIHSGGVSTGGDDFFTGLGQTDQAKNTLRPSDETIRAKVVPSLKEALEKERSNDIVTGALIALGKIGDERTEDGKSEFEPLLAKFLADANQEIAETAAVALGILANEASIPKLKDLALDTREGRKLVGGGTEVKYRTRAFATYGLGLIGARTGKNEVRQEIARILVDILKGPDTSTRDLKVAAVIAFGLTPIDVDPSENPEGTSNDSSRQAQIKYLRRFYQDQNNHYMIRAHVPTAMARLLAGAPDDLRDEVAKVVLPALDRNSKEKDEVRQSCVLALGMIGDSDTDRIDADIRAALKRMADDGDQQSRHFSNIAMAQVGGRPGKGADNEKGQKEAREFLIDQLTKGKTQMKPWAGIGIGVMEHSLAKNEVAPTSASGTAKGLLRKALQDAVSPEQVGAYSIGLGIAADVEAKKLLAEKLAKTSEPNAKGYVAIGLGLMDARDSIGEIQTVVRDSKYKPDLLKSAAIGLGLLGDKELVPELVTMLSESKAQSSQAAIASALGFIGDSRSIDPLVAMLKKKEITDSARGFGAVALGIVADKEPLPWNSKISTNINYRANTTTLTGENGTGILDIL
ncbi:MAG: HEAT repeat domain-containing protein [Planctomycetes bacterium]|nr:HEAT repeat domain-containing protein [Planctomycetota bacterium]